MKSAKIEEYFRKNISKRNGIILQKLCNKLTKNTVGLRGFMRGGRGRGLGRRRGCVKIGRGVVYCGIFFSGFVGRGCSE
jgi:hypothetical protein